MRRFIPIPASAFIIAAALAVPSAVHANPRDNIAALAATIRAAGYTSEAADIEALASTMSDADAQALTDAGIPKVTAALNTASQARDLAENMGASFPALPGTGATQPGTGMAERSAGFPDGDYPDPAKCTESPDGSNFDVVFVLFTSTQAARAAVEIARDVVDLAGWGCSTVVVAIGVGGNPQTVACAIAQIALTVANGILSGFEVAIEVVNFCDDAITFTDVKLSLERLSHVHDDLGQHDTDIKTLLAAIINQLDRIEGKMDLSLKSQAEIAMHKRHKTRPSVFYEERLDEICGYAQEAINDLPVVYLAASQAQAMHDRAIQFKVTDPKRASDECIRAFQAATVRADSIQ